MKKSHRETKKRILRAVDLWSKRLGLGGWIIGHSFVVDNAAIGHEGDIAAEVTKRQWNYQLAEVTWSLPVMSRLDSHDFTEVIIHELLHIALSPISGKHREREEFAVTNIARGLTLAFGGQP